MYLYRLFVAERRGNPVIDQTLCVSKLTLSAAYTPYTASIIVTRFYTVNA